MAQEIVGYLLVGKDGTAVQQWGGTAGQMPGIPNPLHLPSGLTQVHCPSVDVSYEDIDGQAYSLQPWQQDVPDAAPEPSIEERIAAIESRTDKLATVLVDKKVATRAEIDVAEVSVAAEEPITLAGGRK